MNPLLNQYTRLLICVIVAVLLWLLTAPAMLLQRDGRCSLFSSLSS